MTPTREQLTAEQAIAQIKRVLETDDGYDTAVSAIERIVAAALAAPPASPPDPPGLVALVREWQAARKPTVLATPGEFLAETFQAAVRRMSAADEALAAYRLDVAEAETPAAGLREELAEIIRWRFPTADGEIMDGVTMLKAAQEIADAIAPYIEKATGGHALAAPPQEAAPMPPVEKGDWVEDNIHIRAVLADRDVEWWNSSEAAGTRLNVTEIRKANGTVWRRP